MVRDRFLKQSLGSLYSQIKQVRAVTKVQGPKQEVAR